MAETAPEEVSGPDAVDTSEDGSTAAPAAFTHYVHLANGDVVKADLSDGSTVGPTHDGSLVIGVYPK